VAVDLYIHVFREGELAEKDFKIFEGGNIGSKWCGWNNLDPDSKTYKLKLEEFRRVELEAHKIVRSKIGNTPHVWVGEAGMSKTRLLKASSKYIPNAILLVKTIIGEDWPVVDEHLIQKIIDAMSVPNNTNCFLNNVEYIISFLENHIGWHAFTAKW
jgi:hypothetical protein